MSDPVWLFDVVKAAGLPVREIAGWRDRGHDDFGSIWGIVAHHTGSNAASAQSIAFHPELGLASQLHLSRTGVVTICGVGVAWHAGQGSWPGIATNNANMVTIGIEAANAGQEWPDVQYDAYVRLCAAILNKLGLPSSRVIGHKEWGAIQGKWDPGAINMDAFRRNVATAQKGSLPLPIPPVNEINAKQRMIEQSTNWLGKRLKIDGADALNELHIGKDGKGRLAEFEHGHIYFYPHVGAFAIPHADPKIAGSGLFEAYAAYGYEGSELGYPVREYSPCGNDANGLGAVQAFQGGVLYRRNGDERGFIVKGKIGMRWADSLYEKGPYGWPTGNEVKHASGEITQSFQHATLRFHPSSVVIDSL